MTKTKSRKSKNAKIAASYAATKERRGSQVCHVRTMKVQANKLSAMQRESLKMMFVEAKWLTNSCIAWLNAGKKLSKFASKSKTVTHKDKDGNDVKSPLDHLGSQIKQSVLQGIEHNLQALSVLKGNGHKVGKLKFRRECKSVDLKQFGNTYQLEGSKLHIQGIAGWMHINGTKQLISDFEIANAKLLNTPKGYYLAVTCYRDKEKEPKPTKKEIGIDFGCQTAITLSDGRKFNAKIQESDRLKRLQRKLAKRFKSKSKGRGKKKRRQQSKRYLRVKHLVRVEYQKMSNRKNAAASEIVHDIKHYRDVYMQDEMIRAWHHGWFGRTVQYSILGRIKAKIKPYAKSVLPAHEPTTQLCYGCGQLHKIPLSKRMYRCDCGIKPEDRDVHSAKNMIFMGKIRLKASIGHNKKIKIVPVERRDFKRRERTTSVPPGASRSRGTTKRLHL